MPILWKYILRHYFSVFFLIAGSFVSLLFVSRMKQIAQFASMGGGFIETLHFIALQMPHVLPFAIPVAAFFAAFLLFQKMSHTNELTAFRSFGIRLRTITHPVWIAALFLSLCNFLLCSEITTKAKHQTRKLYTEKTSENPLFLLKKHNVASITNSYLYLEEEGEKIKNLLMIGTNPYHDSLFLVSAEELHYRENVLEGRNFSSLFFLPKPTEFDTLYIENDEKIHSLSPKISSQLKKNKYRLNPSSLPIANLLIRAKDQKTIVREFIRRISLGVFPLTCSLLGISYGITIARKKKEKLIKAFLFCALLLSSYLAAKQIKSIFWLSSFLFIAPHFFIYYWSWKNYKNIIAGKQ